MMLQSSESQYSLRITGQYVACGIHNVRDIMAVVLHTYMCI